MSLNTNIMSYKKLMSLGEDILTKQNNYDFNIQIRGRYWLTVLELDTWASNIFINHRLILILFHMSLKNMART